MEVIALIVSVVVLAVVTGYLIGSMVKSIVDERRNQNIKKIWKNFGLSIAFCILFLVSWGAQAVAEWQQYAEDQHTHGEPVVASEYFVEFAQSTLENWQSEFLQLFSFVVLSAVLIHRGSAESKDSDERIETILRRIEQKLDEKKAA
jgi:uncharacterized membrane protein YraQ (UPF0718 family)